jgi:hypothetical protein
MPNENTQNAGTSAAKFFVAIVLFVGIHSANAQTAPPADVPSALAVPAGLELVVSAHATGSQIYNCVAGADGKFAWTLTAPDAELRDSEGKLIGHHFAGPTWKLTDGSTVVGKAAAHVDSPAKDSPDTDSIPWLLVNVVSHAGKGQLTNVTTIQRLHTHGGKPPATGCDEAHKGAETKSGYTADYYFYAPRP